MQLKIVTTACPIVHPLQTAGYARAALWTDSPVWPESIHLSFKKRSKILTQAQLDVCKALQKSLQPADPAVSKEFIILTLGDTFHMCFQGLRVTKLDWARNTNIWGPFFKNIL